MLRAYVHFLLVNLYGQPYTKEGALDTKSVPLKLDTDLEKVLKRNTVEEVYTSIQADIDEARKLVMKAEWEQRYSYRFNAASVEAFQSRVSLYKGEWQAAWDAAEAVLAVKSVLVDLNDAAATLPNSYNSVENITPLETPLSSTINGAALATPVFLSLMLRTTFGWTNILLKRMKKVSGRIRRREAITTCVLSVWVKYI